MKAITVATENNGYFETLKESSMRYNYHLVVLGYEQEWKGFGWRLNLVLEYLKTLPSDEIVIVVDAYDVIFLRDSKELKEEFLKMNVKFLCGAFRKLGGVLGFLQECEFGKEKSELPSPYNNICAGTYIGRVRDILDIYENYEIEDGEDDQVLLNRIYDDMEGAITPDSEFKIFCTLFPTIFTRSVRTEDKIIVTSNKKLKCNATNTYPFVIHGLANMNLDDIARDLGFENYKSETPFFYLVKKWFYHLKLVIYSIVNAIINYISRI